VLKPREELKETYEDKDTHSDNVVDLVSGVMSIHWFPSERGLLINVKVVLNLIDADPSIMSE